MDPKTAGAPPPPASHLENPEQGLEVPPTGTVWGQICSSSMDLGRLL